MTSQPPGSGRNNGMPPKSKSGRTEQLSAYHDGEVSPERSNEIEAWLAADLDARETLESWRSLDDALRHGLDPVTRQPVPVHLTRRLGLWSTVSIRQFAAAAVLLLVSASAGWFARGASGPVAFPGEALRAHTIYAAEKRHPVEVRASRTAHLERWLTKRTGVPIVAPSLSGQGYRFMGGRLLSSSAGPAALLMYEDAAANRVSLIVARAGGQVSDSARTVKTETSAGRFWSEGDALYAVVGAADNSLLPRLEDAIAAGKNGI